MIIGRQAGQYVSIDAGWWVDEAERVYGSCFLITLIFLVQQAARHSSKTEDNEGDLGFEMT